MDVDNTRKHPRPRSRLSICRVSFRPLRPPLYCSIRCWLHSSRHDYRFHRENHEHCHWRTGFCWHRGWHQRAYSPRCRFRNGTCVEERPIRRDPRLHNHSVLSVGPLCPTHCGMYVILGSDPNSIYLNFQSRRPKLGAIAKHGTRGACLNSKTHHYRL